MYSYWRDYFARNGIGLGLFLLISVLLWIVVMIVLPQAFMVDFSFRANVPPPQWGSDKHVHMLQHHHNLLDGSDSAEGQFNVIDLAVFGHTILAAVFVTLIDLALCYPVAFYLAHVAKGGWARLMVMSLVVPFWINEILRAFAFRVLFGSNGVINDVLMALGILDQPFDFIRENVALYSGLSYACILLMIFPIYNAVESLDRNQLEAARDMGAPWWRIHWRIVLPHAKPGISSGCTMVFMLSAGALAAPQVLGGPSSLWFTELIYKAFNNSANWARGSAYALVLLLACILFVLLMMRLFKVRLGEIVR